MNIVDDFNNNNNNNNDDDDYRLYVMTVVTYKDRVHCSPKKMSVSSLTLLPG